MKAVFSTILLAAAVRSQDDDCQLGEDCSKKSIKSSSSMLSKLEVQNDSLIKNYKKTLADYGCYCFTTVNGQSNQHVGGAGIPLDDLDRACRDLYLAYTCLEHDNQNGEYARSCSHTGSFSWYMDVNDEIQCGKDDGNSWGSSSKNACKMDLCAIEKKFADTVHSLFQGGFTVDNNNYNAQTKGACEKVAGAAGAGGSSSIQCCGEYPNRKTAPSGANVNCCGDQGKSFNGLTHDCCNGVPSALGAC